LSYNGMCIKKQCSLKYISSSSVTRFRKLGVILYMHNNFKWATPTALWRKLPLPVWNLGIPFIVLSRQQ